MADKDSIKNEQDLPLPDALMAKAMPPAAAEPALAVSPVKVEAERPVPGNVAMAASMVKADVISRVEAVKDGVPALFLTAVDVAGLGVALVTLNGDKLHADQVKFGKDSERLLDGADAVMVMPASMLMVAGVRGAAKTIATGNLRAGMREAFEYLPGYEIYTAEETVLKKGDGHFRDTGIAMAAAREAVENLIYNKPKDVVVADRATPVMPQAVPDGTSAQASPVPKL